MFRSGPFLHTYQVFVDNAVAGSKEGENMRNEVLLLRLQGLPVRDVFGKVHLKHGKKEAMKQTKRPGLRVPRPVPERRGCGREQPGPAPPSPPPPSRRRPRPSCTSARCRGTGWGRWRSGGGCPAAAAPPPPPPRPAAPGAAESGSGSARLASAAGAGRGAEATPGFGGKLRDGGWPGEGVARRPPRGTGARGQPPAGTRERRDHAWGRGGRRSEGCMSRRGRGRGEGRRAGAAPGLSALTGFLSPSWKILRAALLARTRALLSAGGCGERGAGWELCGAPGRGAGGRAGAHRVLLVAQRQVLHGRQVLRGRQAGLVVAGGERGAGGQHGGRQASGTERRERGGPAPPLYIPFELGARTSGWPLTARTAPSAARPRAPIGWRAGRGPACHCGGGGGSGRESPALCFGAGRSGGKGGRAGRPRPSRRPRPPA